MDVRKLVTARLEREKDTANQISSRIRLRTSSTMHNLPTENLKLGACGDKMKKLGNQSSLFATPIQPRKLAPEADEFWQAVRTLRLAGHKVYRAGRWKHLIDGRRVGENQILLMAEAKRSKVPSTNLKLD